MKHHVGLESGDGAASRTPVYRVGGVDDAAEQAEDRRGRWPASSRRTGTGGSRPRRRERPAAPSFSRRRCRLAEPADSVIVLAATGVAIDRSVQYGGQGWGVRKQSAHVRVSSSRDEFPSLRGGNASPNRLTIDPSGQAGEDSADEHSRQDTPLQDRADAHPDPARRLSRGTRPHGAPHGTGLGTQPRARRRSATTATSPPSSSRRISRSSTSSRAWSMRRGTPLVGRAEQAPPDGRGRRARVLSVFLQCRVRPVLPARGVPVEDSRSRPSSSASTCRPATTRTRSRPIPSSYMQDGQNLFFPDEAFMGHDWKVDRDQRRRCAR